MKSIDLHQVAIDTLSLHDRCRNEIIRMEDNVTNYGKNRVEFFPKSKLEHQLEIKKMALYRIQVRYERVLNTLQKQYLQRVF
jgi:hypothetical protein